MITRPSKIFENFVIIINTMIKEKISDWWRRLTKKLPWRKKGLPVWGEGSPNILGVCRECGAAVLEGWHRNVEDGYLCQRCAAQKAAKEKEKE